MVSFSATAAGLNSKRLLSTSCNKQGQRFFFMVPMLFEVRRIVCVNKQTLNNELKFHIVNIY